MSEKIATRVPDYSGEKVGTWPPLEPSGDKGYFWLDETGHLTDEPPEPKHNVFGRSAYVMQDTIDAYKHPATGQYVESRSALRAMDEATGTITTDKYIPPDPTKQNEIKRRNREWEKQNLRESLELVKSGNTPFTETEKAEFRMRDKQIDQTVGFDVFSKIGKAKK